MNEIDRIRFLNDVARKLKKTDRVGFITKGFEIEFHDVDGTRNREYEIMKNHDPDRHIGMVEVNGSESYAGASATVHSRDHSSYFVTAKGEDIDFDALLAELRDKFERGEGFKKHLDENPEEKLRHLIEHHDTYHAYSDSHAVWSSGNAELKKIRELADKLGEVGEKILNETESGLFYGRLKTAKGDEDTPERYGYHHGATEKEVA